jgi:hypothetical protein
MSVEHPVLTSDSDLDLEIASRARAIELDNWGFFDVHRWSEYPEVNAAVNTIYLDLTSNPSFSGQAKLRKKHIKVIILDLYVKWLQDPSMYSGFYRGKYYYDDLEARYNKLFISKLTIPISDALSSMGYIDYIQGHYNRNSSSSNKSHISRMRAKHKLIDLIESAGIKPDMVEIAPNTECIILRSYSEKKKQQQDVDYNDSDDPRISEWRLNLLAYNNLLRRTYIDVPSAPEEGMPTRSKRTLRRGRTSKKVKVNQLNKFVRRIFNNGNWNNGGRFYGGWWQRIPKDWRTKIRIWNSPVTEIDYSGLHIVLLYSKEGITYREDPYILEGYEKSEEMRSLLKLVLLASINANDKNKALQAVHKDVNFDSDRFGWVKEEGINLSQVIEAFKNKHSRISDLYFFSGEGVRLQNIDSRIAEHVINHFTHQNIPVLCVHDSFVIQTDKAEELKTVMTHAFNDAISQIEIAPETDPKVTFGGLELGQWQDIISQPEWREVMIGYLTGWHTYPKWNERLNAFKARKLENYYIA